jgi:aminoglycoside phosphotransferase (APT) family kinase protein
LSRIGLGLSSEAWLVRDGDRRSVLRLALETSTWPSTYRSEHVIMSVLAARGARVPEPILGSWEVAGWSSAPWSLTSYAAGAPLSATSRGWAAPLVGAFVELVRSVPVSGFGPISQADGALSGTAPDPLSGLRAWMDGDSLWPFDETHLAAHPALVDWPDLAKALEIQAGQIEAAAIGGRVAIIHADLHDENILEDEDRLSFIDFGEAFIGSIDWEYATLAYFMGWEFADHSIGALRSDPRDAANRRRSAAALALSFGVHRWTQDRRNGLDEDSHNESFLRSSLVRLAQVGPGTHP